VAHTPFWVRTELREALRHIGVKQQRFHKDGNWYHPLRTFPGALCDPGGYVVFGSEREFVSCPYLVLRKDVHTESGYTIADIPGYVGIPSGLTKGDG
jgi:hypothetical protein